MTIEENLKRIFNTKKGSIPLMHDFGISSKFIDEVLNHELLIDLKDEIINQILTYEPRIKIKDIELIPNGSQININIKVKDEELEIELY